jgi:hypothetical protein
VSLNISLYPSNQATKNRGNEAMMLSSVNILTKGVTAMTQQPYTPDQESQILTGIREGMPIYDAADKKVGTVKYVQFPVETNLSDRVEEPAYLNVLGNIPPDIRARLLREGFVEVEGGLFSSSRYILPHQILEVADDHIRLEVLKDALIKS